MSAPLPAPNGPPVARRPGLADPELRGSVTVSSTAVRHLVEAAAGEVPGVVDRRSARVRRSEGGVRAHVLVDHDRARVRLAVSLVYPAVVPVMLQEIRTHVAQRVADLAQVRITGFDVVVDRFVLPHAPDVRAVE